MTDKTGASDFQIQGTDFHVRRRIDLWIREHLHEENRTKFFQKPSVECRKQKAKVCWKRELVEIMTRIPSENCASNVSTSENGATQTHARLLSAQDQRGAFRSPAPRNGVEPCPGPPCRRRSPQQNAAGSYSGREPRRAVCCCVVVLLCCCVVVVVVVVVVVSESALCVCMPTPHTRATQLS